MTCVSQTTVRVDEATFLDLLGAQDRLADERFGDVLQPCGPVVGRHDGVGVETRSIDDAQPQLRFVVARAGARQAGRQRAELALLGESLRRAVVAQQAQTLLAARSQSMSLNHGWA